MSLSNNTLQLKFMKRGASKSIIPTIPEQKPSTKPISKAEQYANDALQNHSTKVFSDGKHTFIRPQNDIIEQIDSTRDSASPVVESKLDKQRNSSKRKTSSSSASIVKPRYLKTFGTYTFIYLYMYIHFLKKQ